MYIPSFKEDDISQIPDFLWLQKSFKTPDKTPEL